MRRLGLVVYVVLATAVTGSVPVFAQSYEPGYMEHRASALTTRGGGVRTGSSSDAARPVDSTVVGIRSKAGTARRRVDAGIGMVVHVYDQYGKLDVPAGGWFTIGGGSVRLQVDYWHQRGQREHKGMVYAGGRRFEEIETRSSSFDSVQMSISRHFRTDRRVTPHVLIGAGAGLGRGEVCRSAEIVHPSLGCRRSSRWRGIVVGGVGLDVSLTSRFFIRVQSRGYTFFEGDDPAWVRLAQATVSHLLVGAGVSF